MNKAPTLKSTLAERPMSLAALFVFVSMAIFSEGNRVPYLLAVSSMVYVLWRDHQCAVFFWSVKQAIAQAKATSDFLTASMDQSAEMCARLMQQNHDLKQRLINAKIDL